MRNFLFNLFPPGGRLRRGVEALLPVVDVLLLPFTLAGARLLGAIRMAGVKHFRVARWVFRKTRVFPVRDHSWRAPFSWSVFFPHRNWLGWMGLSSCEINQ